MAKTFVKLNKGVTFIFDGKHAISTPEIHEVEKTAKIAGYINSKALVECTEAEYLAQKAKPSETKTEEPKKEELKK